MKTIAAIATGNAVGGIGIVRISGDEAISVADKVFKSADSTSLSSLKGYRAKFGNIIEKGKAIDNAVALVFCAPKSYTGEDVVELSVHGGLLIVQKTLQAVLSAGAVPAQAGEFTKRAFLNGKMDLTQAESVADLISSQGEENMKASFNALQGSLSKTINFALEKLLDCSALMAAWVDYPDEEIEELSDDKLIETLSQVRSQLKTLLNNYDCGQTVTNGIDTAIVGRPNVGKSSLMNMLSGTDKSIVTHIEGTTRDIVEGDVTLGGIVLHLRDTAGIRQSDDVVESIGIEKAYNALDSAQLVLAVFDSSKPIDEKDVELAEMCKAKTAVAVINKTDLHAEFDIGKIKDKFKKIVYICAKDYVGLDDLSKSVNELMGVAGFDSSAPMLANARQKQNCQNAYDEICTALESAKAGMTFDAINVMIDSAADELLSLTGRKATTEVVNNIFSKFCVGK